MNHEGLDTDRRPLVLVWEVTQACSLACKHCRADAKPDRHPDELSTVEGKALLSEVSRFGDGQLVVLSGGDPLARDDLIELVDVGTNRGLSMTLTPSGTDSLTPGVIRDLVDADLRRMALSLDGATAETHDEFRGETGSFDQTMAAAEAAREAGLPLQINTTVCRETVDELPAIRDRVADLGAVLWSVFFLVPIGRGRVLSPVSPDRAESVMEWLVSVARSSPFRVKTTEAPHYRRVRLQQAADDGDIPPRRGGITAGDGFAFVSHVGDVYPSGFLPASAGNVREESVVDLYRDADLFTALRDPELLMGKCGACPFRSVCGGSRSRAYAYTGNPLESDPLCPFVPEAFDGPVPEQRLSTTE